MKNIFIKKLHRAMAALCVFALLGIISWSSYQVFVLNDVGIYKENGLLENLQALILLTSCLTFISLAIFKKRPDKLIILFFALICYSLVLRELDIEKFSFVPPIIVPIMYGTGRNITISIAFVVIFIFAIKNFFYYTALMAYYAKTIFAKIILVSVVFAISGQLFENYNALPHHVYFEEILEFFSYVSILSATAVVSNDSYIEKIPSRFRNINKKMIVCSE